MLSKNKTVVGGFVFENEEEAAQAQKEVKGIQYIKSKTNMDDPQMVLQIYNKIIQQQLFETAVGFAYLKDLQEYLITVPYVANEDVLPIPVHHKALERSLKKKKKAPAKAEKSVAKPEKKELSRVETQYKNRFHVTLFLAVVMAVSMAGMLLITLNSNNLNILNYENELINRYENWEKELDAREAVIKQREEELGVHNE